MRASCLTLASCQAEPTTTPATAPPESLRGTNVLLITVDTTRRDHISAYGEPGFEGLTPAIDRLAASGTLFVNAYSQSNSTNPAHTSLFTGTYGLDNQIMNNKISYAKAGAGLDTLAEAFQRAGYRTAAFAATPHVSRSLLDLPGFEHATPPTEEIPADRMVDRVLQWTDHEPSRPFFVWLHLFDPHAPYAAPADYQAEFYQGDPTAGDGLPLGRDARFNDRMAPGVRKQFGKVRDHTYPPAMYRAEVRFLDDQIGRLLAQLEARGAASSTAIVLIADHGENLGEHGIYFAHNGLYEPSIRIPFLMRLPGFPSGLRITDPVGQIDLHPTLVELFDLEVDTRAPLRGVSLVDALRGKAATEASTRELLVYESSDNREVAVRRGRWKAIFSIWWAAPSVLLFDLETDPGELRDVGHEHPELVAELRTAAEPWFDHGRWLKPATPTLDKAIAERLRTLGYIPVSEKPPPADARVNGPESERGASSAP